MDQKSDQRESVIKRRAKRIGIVGLCLLMTTIVGAVGIPLWTHGSTTTGTTPTESTKQRELPSASVPDTTLKVVTLNVAHGRRDGRHQALVSTKTIRSNLDEVASVLVRDAPDVVALQEADGPSIWSGSFDHVEYMAEQAGFAHSFRGRHVHGLKLSYGTALLSCLPLDDCVSKTFAPSPPTLSKGIVIGLIAWPSRPDVNLTVASVHLDFARASVRQSQVKEIIQLVGDIERPLLLMGDFNCEWQGDETSLRMLADQLDLRAFESSATNRSTFPGSGKRLDWILISPDLEFVQYTNVDDTLSDHQGVTAELRLTRK